MKLFKWVERIGRYVVLVQTRDIQDGAITEELIALGAVTTDKIANGAVTRDKLGDGAVEDLNAVIEEMEGLNAESRRVTTAADEAEQLRATAEELRVIAENARVRAEQNRDSSESARVRAEQLRVIAERARAAAEASRVSTESIRIVSEQSRVNAEHDRVALYNELTTLKRTLQNLIGHINELGGLTPEEQEKLNSLPTAEELETALGRKQDSLSGYGVMSIDENHIVFDHGRITGVYKGIDEDDPQHAIHWPETNDKLCTTKGVKDYLDYYNYYKKPQSGIPASDLASAVQSALSAASSALQPADLQTLQGKVSALESLISEGENPTAAIDKFNEIVAFLSNITNSDTLSGIVIGINNAIAAKYSKPSGGIPASDLANGVQTSLGKADSAYQKPSSGIPASDLANGVQTSLGKADSAYQKPSSGIPASDLANGVIPEADSSVVQNSTNPVQGGAVYEALRNVSVAVDSSLSDNSDNPVKNSVIKAALDAKQDTIEEVTASVDANTGTPSASVSFNNGELAFSFSNLKGAKGDTGAAGANGAQGIQGATGPQGPKGDTGVTGDVSDLVIKQAIDVTEDYDDTDVAGAVTVKDLTNEDLDNEDVIARALVEFASYFNDGYAFKGIANEKTGVGEQIQKVAYILTPGTYKQFGNSTFVIEEDNIGLAFWDGIKWDLDVCPFYTGDVVIDDFTDWDSKYYDTYGVWSENSQWKTKRIKLLAGQTILIKTGGNIPNGTTGLTPLLLFDENSNIIARSSINANTLNTVEYTSLKTQYYYVTVRVGVSSGTLIPPSVRISSVGVKNIKKENIVEFGKGDDWNDVVSALELKDKTIVTEKSASIVSGSMSRTHPGSGNGHLFIFKNDGYKYMYALVPYSGDGTYWAYALYSDEETNDNTLLKYRRYADIPIKNNVCIIKTEIPENCEYIYVVADNTQSLDGEYNKVYLFRDTSLVSLRFALDNFALSTNSVLNESTTVESIYSNYGEYINIRNSFGKRVNNTNATFRCMFVSDIHGLTGSGNTTALDNVDRFKRIVNLTNKWFEEGYVDAMIATGDIAFNKATEDYTWFHNLRALCKVDILTTPGNHDWNYQVTADKERTYNNIIAPMVNGITVNEGEENEEVLGQVENIIQPNDAEENHRFYYYKDYNDVRFIGIYTSTDSSDQLTWLQNVLADAVTNEKSVIIGNHSPFSDSIAPIKFNSISDFYENCSNTFRTPDGTFMNTSDNMTGSGSDTPINSSYVAAVKTFMDNGGTFICWLSGHTHRDCFYDVTNHNTYGYQLMLNTNAVTPHLSTYDLVRSGGANNRDCFNYLTVDTTLHLLKVLRIGVNVDVLGRGRLVFVYDYVNHKIVTNY